MSLKDTLTSIKTVEDTLTSNKVANFAYTDKAYTDNDADGVETYNVANEQNIPVSTASILKINDTVLTKGYRSQASSVTRMLMNHFLGRLSYNLNKVNDNMSSLLSALQTNLGNNANFTTSLNSLSPDAGGNITIKGSNIAVSDTDTNTIEEELNLSMKFTYIVNSKESLIYWLSNKASGTSSGGSDFTSVLIKKGEYILDDAELTVVSLTDIGTVTITGEAGSVITYTKSASSSNAYLFGYTSVPHGDHKITGLNINANSVSVGVSLFYQCINITDCYIRCTSYTSASISGKNTNTTCMESCNNISNCTFYLTGSWFGDSVMYLCKNVSCVKAHFAFHGSTTYQARYLSAFDGCSYLSHVIVELNPDSTQTNPIVGFDNCYYMVSCSGEATSAGSDPGRVYVFAECKFVSTCSSMCTFPGIESSSSIHYCYYLCRSMHGNYGSAPSITNTAVFSSCYSSYTEDSSHQCDDTSAGGFNYGVTS